MNFLKTVIFGLFLMISSIEGQEGRVLDKLIQGKQYLELTYFPATKEIEISGKNGRAFARTHRQRFNVSNDEMVERSLNELNFFLNNKSFHTSFFDRIKSVFDDFKILNDRECRALFLSLSGPLASQDVDSFIEQLDQVGKFLVAPDDATKSFDIEEIDVNGQKIGLRLFLNSTGEPVSLGIVAREGDFRGLRFQGSIKDGYSLFSPGGEWLMGLKIDLNNEITLNVIRPMSHQLLVNSEKDLIKLTVEEGQWQVDNGSLGINHGTFHEEWLSLARLYGLDQHAPVLVALFEQSFKNCRIYEDQRRRFESVGSFCERQLELESMAQKSLLELEQMGAQPDSILPDLRRCLTIKNIATTQHDVILYNVGYEGDVNKEALNCLDNIMLPFKQDELVLTLTETQLGLVFLNNESLKRSFSETLHKEGFQTCQKKKLNLSDEACQKILNEVSDEQFVTAALSHFSLKNPLLNHQQADKNRRDLVAGWSECQVKNVQCVGELLKRSVAFELEHISPMVERFPFSWEFDLDKYQVLKVEFDGYFSACLHDAFENEKVLAHLLLSFEELKQRCQERSSLMVFPTVFADYLKNKVFKNYSGLEPEFFDAFIENEKVAISQDISDKSLRHFQQIEDGFQERIHETFAKGMSEYISLQAEKVFPLRGESSVYANRELHSKWLEEIKKKLNSPSDESIELSLRRIVQGKNLDEAKVHVNEIIKDIFKLTNRLSLPRDLLTSIQDSQRREQVMNSTFEEFDECVNSIASNQRDRDLSIVLLSCEKKKKGRLLFEKAKERFEQQVSHVFPLTGQKANRILSPIWDLSLCVNQQPESQLEEVEYLARIQACIDLTKIDISFNLAMEQLGNISSLLKPQDRDGPEVVARYCFSSIFLQMASKDPSLNKVITQNESYAHIRERSRSIMDIQREKMEKKRSLLSYLSRGHESHTNSFAPSDASKINTLIRDMVNSREHFSETWIDEAIINCMEGVQETTYNSIRESFLKNSPHFQGRQTNRVGETDAEVMRNILDNETIQLVLQMRDHQEGLRLRSIIDPRETLITREFAMDTLSRSTEVIAQYLGQGFVFDRDILKTELVIFRGELNEALRWMNTREEPVAMKELGVFFQTSELANILAVAEVSSQVQGRFFSFINEMEINDLAVFNRKVGHRSYSRLNKVEKTERQAILDKYKNLRELTKEMTGSYDFRRIIMQDPRKGQELLELIKTTSILPQISGMEVSPNARTEIWRKIGDLILQDSTPGGFAERFVAEVAQGHLDNERDSKWAITKWLFYSDGDFKWDSLRSTASGRRALNYYGRYLLLPRVLDIKMTPYLKNLREEEFKRHLGRAQSEN